MHRVCLWYVRSAYLSHYPPAMALNLPSLYEPLIRLLERGHFFSTAHSRYIDVAGVGIPILSPERYIAHPPLQDLGDDALDRGEQH